MSVKNNDIKRVLRSKNPVSSQKNVKRETISVKPAKPKRASKIKKASVKSKIKDKELDRAKKIALVAVFKNSKHVPIQTESVMASEDGNNIHGPLSPVNDGSYNVLESVMASEDGNNIHGPLSPVNDGSYNVLELEEVFLGDSDEESKITSTGQSNMNMHGQSSCHINIGSPINVEEDLYLSSSSSHHSKGDNVSSDSGFGFHDLKTIKRSRKRRINNLPLYKSSVSDLKRKQADRVGVYAFPKIKRSEMDARNIDLNLECNLHQNIAEVLIRDIFEMESKFELEKNKVSHLNLFMREQNLHKRNILEEISIHHREQFITGSIFDYKIQALFEEAITDRHSMWCQTNNEGTIINCNIKSHGKSSPAKQCNVTVKRLKSSEVDDANEVYESILDSSENPVLKNTECKSSLLLTEINEINVVSNNSINYLSIDQLPAESTHYSPDKFQECLDDDTNKDDECIQDSSLNSPVINKEVKNTECKSLPHLTVINEMNSVSNNMNYQSLNQLLAESPHCSPDKFQECLDNEECKNELILEPEPKKINQEIPFKRPKHILSKNVENIQSSSSYSILDYNTTSTAIKGKVNNNGNDKLNTKGETVFKPERSVAFQGGKANLTSLVVTKGLTEHRNTKVSNTSTSTKKEPNFEGNTVLRQDFQNSLALIREADVFGFPSNSLCKLADKPFCAKLHHDNRLEKLKTIKCNKLQVTTVASEPIVRKRITFDQTDQLNNSGICIPTSSSGIKNRSIINAAEEINLSIHKRDPLSSNGFSFTKPLIIPKGVHHNNHKSVRHQKGNYINYPDDESLMSLLVSDELVSDIDNCAREPAPKQTVWMNFERSDDEDDEPANDKLLDELPLDSSHSPSPQVLEKVTTWNLKNEMLGKDGNQTNKTVNCKGNQDNLFKDDIKDPLHDTPLQGYCISYLRTSYDDHCCSLIHKVPHQLLLGTHHQNADKINHVIVEIISVGFKNPPETLVSTFVSFCLQFNNKNTLAHLGRCLKNSIDLLYENEETANEIWYEFLKTIVDSKNSTLLRGKNKWKFISMILQDIFLDKNCVNTSDSKALTSVLNALIKVNTDNKLEVQLLMCVDFLFKNGYNYRADHLKLIPLNFVISVLNQCLDAMQQPKFARNFPYKVLKSFFDTDFSYVKDLYNYNKNVVISFFEIVESTQAVDWSRNFTLQRVKDFLICESEKSSFANKSHTAYASSISNHLQPECNQLLKATQPLSLTKSREKSEEINIIDMCDWFKPPLKTKEVLTALKVLREHVQEVLSDVDDSFIPSEAKATQLDVLNKLYNSLSHFDFKSIKNNTPASTILIVVHYLLQINKILDALNIFTKYNPVKDVLESKMMYSVINKIIESLDDVKLYNVITKIIPLEKSLAEALDLSSLLNCLIVRLVEKRQTSKTASLASLVFDENKSKLLKLQGSYLYRILVVILCNEGDLIYAFMMWLKATKRVSLYPKHIKDMKLENDSSVELYSCLTKQEMKVVIYSILKLHGESLKMSSLYVTFKVKNEHQEELIPLVCRLYLTHEDCAISSAVQRCKAAVVELIPHANLWQKGNDTIAIQNINNQKVR